MPSTPDVPADETPRRVGIFGGTFDPIHIAHLILVEEARYCLQLDQVLLVPAGDPPHKQGREVSPVEDRVRMCELAAAEADYLAVSRVDADRPGPHYSADMVELLQQRLGAGVQFFFLIGLDSLRDLPTWHEPARLMQSCMLVALSRHDVDIDWAALERALPGIRERVILLDMPELEISGSLLRQRVRSGAPIRFQTTKAVEEYVYRRGLYRT